MIDVDSSRQQIDNIIRHTRSQFPNAELHELGALLNYVGAFLIASAIPELRAKYIDTVNISEQLLTQDNNKHAEDQPSVTGPMHTNRTSD